MILSSGLRTGMTGSPRTRETVTKRTLAWKINFCQTIDEFRLDKKMETRSANLKGIIFKDGGRTNSKTLIWSGETLMDLDLYQALKVTPTTIDGGNYLFTDHGEFSYAVLSRPAAIRITIKLKASTWMTWQGQV